MSRRERDFRYDHSPKGLARRRKYLASPKRRAAWQRYQKTAKRRAAWTRYNRGPKHRACRFRKLPFGSLYLHTKEAA